MFDQNFINYLQFEKRYSIHTVTAYKNDLEQFSFFMKEQYNTEDIMFSDYMMIRSWMVKLMEEKNTTRTVNRKISSLKTYFKYLIKEGKLSDNPMKKIISPKNSKRLPEFVEEDKIKNLLDNVDFGSGFSAIRDRLIIEMFYATGMRLSELVNLKTADVNLFSCTLKVLGKRNKERILPFYSELKDLILDYQNAIKKEIGEINHEYFFVTDKGTQIYQKMVYRLVTHYLGEVTTLTKKSPHVLRHTFATHMLNKGADLNAIKELLGHANLSATQIYTHNTIEKLKTIYKQAHPKA